MTTESTEAVNCAICGGSREEHKDSKHVFTTNHGELKTPQESAREQAKVVARGNVSALPVGMAVIAPGAQGNAGTTSLDRLVDVLMSKGILSNREALHILLGRPL